MKKGRSYNDDTFAKDRKDNKNDRNDRSDRRKREDHAPIVEISDD
jgi:hypothetical protein